MDYYIDDLKMLIEQNGGIFSAGEIQNAGIERHVFMNALKKVSFLRSLMEIMY